MVRKLSVMLTASAMLFATEPGFASSVIWRLVPKIHADQKVVRGRCSVTVNFRGTITEVGKFDSQDPIHIAYQFLRDDGDNSEVFPAYAIDIHSQFKGRSTTNNIDYGWSFLTPIHYKGWAQVHAWSTDHTGEGYSEKKEFAAECYKS